MRNRLIGFIICLAVLGLCVFIFFNLFEIVEHTKLLPPSKEAQRNEYLALDRWLLSEGINVEIKNTGNIDVFRNAAEKIIFVRTSYIKWDDEIISFFNEWVQNGGRLILSLDFFYFDMDNPLFVYLDNLGIYFSYDPDEIRYNYLYDENSPTFGRGYNFSAPADTALVLYDADDLIRFVEIKKGSGKITVTGRPRFMTNFNIIEEPNARLCWHLFSGADSVLFIRGGDISEGLMGGFFRRGNFLIIIIAALFLTIIGFWSVIPVFGVVRDSGVPKGKTLADRFLAEGNFYMKNNSLHVYRLVYLREIKRKMTIKNIQYTPDIPNDPLIKKNFLNTVKNLKTEMEQL